MDGKASSTYYCNHGTSDDEQTSIRVTRRFQKNFFSRSGSSKTPQVNTTNQAPETRNEF